MCSSRLSRNANDALHGGTDKTLFRYFRARRNDFFIHRLFSAAALRISAWCNSLRFRPFESIAQFQEFWDEELLWWGRGFHDRKFLSAASSSSSTLVDGKATRHIILHFGSLRCVNHYEIEKYGVACSIADIVVGFCRLNAKVIMNYGICSSISLIEHYFVQLPCHPSPDYRLDLYSRPIE